MPIYADFDGNDIKMNCTQIATEVERMMARWKSFAEKVSGIPADDLTGLGLSADYQTWMGSFLVSLKNIELKYRNQAPLNSDDPSYFIKIFSSLTAF